MSCEVTIKVKDKTKTMAKKTRVYSRIQADFSDDKIDELVAEAVKQFGGDHEVRKIDVTIKLIQD